MARKAAHAGAQQLLVSLNDYMAREGAILGTLPDVCPAANPYAPFGCQELYHRDGVKVYYALHEHPSDEPWTYGLGPEGGGMFNINAMGFEADLGSNADYGIRYTSFETSLVRLIASRFDTYAGVATGGGADTLEDTSQHWTRGDDLEDKDLFIVSGTGNGQSRTIVDFDSTTLTVDSNWATQPDATSAYVISDDPSYRISSYYASFASSAYVRQRVAILLAKAIILGRQYGGSDTIPGVSGSEEKRLGHLPRWSETLGCTNINAGVQFPSDSNNKNEFGWDNLLPSSFTERLPTTGVYDWSYAEPGIWRSYTYTSSTPPNSDSWNDDDGVNASAITWGKILSVAAGPPYTVTMNTTLPGWNDWPVNRWYDTTGTEHYFLYIATGPAKGWYEISDANSPADGVGSGSNSVELPFPPSPDPGLGDPFCIVHVEGVSTLPRTVCLGARMNERWEDGVNDTGDLLPTALYWPDGTLTTEENVLDLAMDSGKVTKAENPNPGPPVVSEPYLEDSSSTWTDDEWNGYVVHIYKGPGIGQVRRIADTIALTHTLEIETDWTAPPANTSLYYIERYDENLPSRYRPDSLQGDDQIYMSLGTLRDSTVIPAIEYDIAPAAQKGAVTSATVSTLVDNTKSWTNNEWATSDVRIAAGTGYGQKFTILSNTLNELTVQGTWTTVPDTTTRYYIRTGTFLNDAEAMANILLPQFQKFLSVSTRSLEANQELAGINDWQVDGIDNDANGVIDDESPTQKDLAYSLYVKLGLRDWVAGNETRFKQAAQLVANIIDFRDDNSIPLELTHTDLGEDATYSDPFTVFGAEGLHVTEIMPSPDADFCEDPTTECTYDGFNDNTVPGYLNDTQGWDWLPAPTEAFVSNDPNSPPTIAGHFVWNFGSAVPGHYAVRLIGTDGPFTLVLPGPVVCTIDMDYPDPEDGTYNHGFVRKDSDNLLLEVGLTAGTTFEFDLVAPGGSKFRGLALLPQYIEITNIAQNDIDLRDDHMPLTIHTYDGTTERTIDLDSTTLTDPWLQLIRGASADGVFPINYGTYVIAMSQEAYAKQWSASATPDATWGNDGANEDYPVFFAGDESDAFAQALLLGAKDGPDPAGERKPSVWITDASNLLIAGYDAINSKGVDGPFSRILVEEDTYSSLEKNVILQATWKVDPLDPDHVFWKSFEAAPASLSGSQNQQLNVQVDDPRPPVSSPTTIYSCLNKNYDEIFWDYGAAPPANDYPNLTQGSVLAEKEHSHVYPIILNRPYPTVGWLGLVPTSNGPWRTVDPAHTGDVADADNPGVEPDPWFQDTAASWTAATPESPVNREIMIIAGTGAGQVRTISAVKGGGPSNILYVTLAWDVVPDATSRYCFLDATRPEEMLGTLMSKAATGGVYARFNINSAPIDVLKCVFDDGQAARIITERDLLAGQYWRSWDTLLNQAIFQNAPTGLGFFDNPALVTDPVNEDSGAGTYADDFMDDSDEREEWARRYGNLFNLRSTAFRFIVAGLVYAETAGGDDPPVAEARIEMDVDLSDPTVGPQVNHFRYLSQ
jgi:hypothetical protein